MESNTKVVIAEVYRRQEYGGSLNGDYMIKTPRGLISYIDDRKGKIIHNFITVWSKTRHGKVNPSWTWGEHIKDVKIGESLVDRIIKEFEEKVSPAISKLASLSRKTYDLCTTILSTIDKYNPILVLHPAVKMSLEGISNNDEERNKIEKECDNFYDIIQKLHDEYIRS